MFYLQETKGIGFKKFFFTHDIIVEQVAPDHLHEHAIQT